MPAPHHPRQLSLPMLTAYSGPRVIEPAAVQACGTYRAAVRACWARRLRTKMTLRQLAEEVGCYASHISDYLHEDDAPKRRDLPAARIAAFEVACGNRLVSQWLARQSQLSVAEEVIEQSRGLYEAKARGDLVEKLKAA